MAGCAFLNRRGWGSLVCLRRKGVRARGYLEGAGPLGNAAGEYGRGGDKWQL